MTDKRPIDHGIAHDKDLEVSYGQPIPQPRMIKGTYEAIGELAGSTSTAKSVEGQRNCHFEDSIEDNKKNQPKGHY